MTPSPIHKVLSIFLNSNARFLLMGGQACVLYGGAEFSRDIDLAVDPDEENLQRVRHALALMQAGRVFVPNLEREKLLRGHACHFRAHSPEVEGLRIDLMALMRGCPPFNDLWERRSIVETGEISELPLLSLPDLVQAKKTQREKDWPMIRRLIEADILSGKDNPSAGQVEFWLEECRTPALLTSLVRDHDALAREVAGRRPAVHQALERDVQGLEKALAAEEARERELDAAYWSPLKGELEDWRRELTRSRKGLGGADS